MPYRDIGRLARETGGRARRRMACLETARGLPLLDLVAEGNLGLMHALEKFDPDRGFRLSTYATWWIRQSTELALMKQSRTIRLPVHVAKELNSCLRARNTLERQGITDPGPEAIAQLTGKAVETVREVLT